MKAIAQYDFQGQASQKQLVFPAGAEVEVAVLPGAVKNDGWWWGSYQGRSGWFPRSYVRVVESKPKTQAGQQEHHQRNLHTAASSSESTYSSSYSYSFSTGVKSRNKEEYPNEVSSRADTKNKPVSKGSVSDPNVSAVDFSSTPMLGGTAGVGHGLNGQMHHFGFSDSSIGVEHASAPPYTSSASESTSARDTVKDFMSKVKVPHWATGVSGMEQPQKRQDQHHQGAARVGRRRSFHVREAKDKSAGSFHEGCQTFSKSCHNVTETHHVQGEKVPYWATGVTGMEQPLKRQDQYYQGAAAKVGRRSSFDVRGVKEKSAGAFHKGCQTFSRSCHNVTEKLKR